jgi:phosphoribosylanthranilate isomerase
VKFCGLVRPADVDAAVAIGADAVGFVFYPRSPRLLDVETAAALRRRLPSWVTAVGLFVDAPPAEITAVAQQVGLDVAQLHGDESLAEAGTLPLRWWKAIRIGEGGVAASPADVAAALTAWHQAECCLLDSASAGYGGSGRAFDWSLVPAGGAGRLVMSGGLDAGNVAMAIAQLRPYAVDASSGIQGANAREKDVGRMEQFMEAVRRADGCPTPPDR